MFTMAIAICNCNEAQCQCIFSQRRQEDLDLLPAMGHGSCLLGISESPNLNPRLCLRFGFGRGHDRLQRAEVESALRAVQLLRRQGAGGLVVRRLGPLALRRRCRRVLVVRRLLFLLVPTRRGRGRAGGLVLVVGRRGRAENGLSGCQRVP